MVRYREVQRKMVRYGEAQRKIPEEHDNGINCITNCQILFNSTICDFPKIPYESPIV